MITLTPHTGTDRRTGRPVEFDQFIIRKDGTQIGYLGKQPGCKPMLLPHARLAEADEAELMALASEATRAEVVASVKVPPLEVNSKKKRGR